MRVLLNPLLWILLAATLLEFWWLISFKDRLGLKTAGIAVLSICNTIAGGAFVKLFAALEGDPGGMRIYGAVFFLPFYCLVVSLVLKIKASEAFDILTIAAVIMAATAKVNCIIAGCCAGIYLDRLSIRFPVRGIEIAFYFLFWNYMGIKVIKKKSEGTVYPVFLISYGLIRFVLEFVTVNPSVFGYLHIAHIWSAASVVIGAATLIYITSKRSLTLVERRTALSGRKIL